MIKVEAKGALYQYLDNTELSQKLNQVILLITHCFEENKETLSYGRWFDIALGNHELHVQSTD